MGLIIPKGDWNLRKALASEIREKIIKIVSKQEMEIGRLAERLAVSTPAIKKHVDFLEKSGLIKSRIDFHARGQPRILMPSEGIFREGLELPFLYDHPSYRKAKTLIDAYRRTSGMELPTTEDIKNIQRNVQRLAEETKFEKIIEAYGWLDRCWVLLRWCFIFLGYFVEKVPLTIYKKKYPDTREIVIGQTIDIADVARGIPLPEAPDVPGEVHIEFLLLRRELEEEETPLSKLALEIIRKYESKIPDLPPEKRDPLESALNELLQMIKDRKEILQKKCQSLEKKKFRPFRNHAEDWRSLAGDFDCCEKVGKMFQELRSSLERVKGEGGEKA